MGGPAEQKEEEEEGGPRQALSINVYRANDAVQSCKVQGRRLFARWLQMIPTPTGRAIPLLLHLGGAK